MLIPIAGNRSLDTENIYLRPLFLSLVQAGYPSPAGDEIDQRLDLNEHIFRNPAMTIMVRMKGDFFKSQGVFNRDMVIADCSLEPQDRQLVVAVIALGVAVAVAVVRVAHYFFSGAVWLSGAAAAGASCGGGAFSASHLA